MAVAKKKCRHCGNYELQTKGVKHPIGFFCSQSHAILFAQDKASKARAKLITKSKQVQVRKVKAQKSKDKARLKELMPVSKWWSKLQVLVNQWVLHVRDHGKPCYTCGTENPNIKYDSGHRHHAGRGGGDRRRFITVNIHKQCSVQCNQHGGGMPKEYDIALDAEYGQGFSDKLMCVTNYPTLKEQFPTWQDIEAEILRYRKLLRDAGLTPNG